MLVIVAVAPVLSCCRVHAVRTSNVVNIAMVFILIVEQLLYPAGFFLLMDEIIAYPPILEKKKVS